MRAWLFQDSRQKKKLGAKAPWSVGWFDPEGKKRSKRIGSKSQAEKFQRKKEGELAAGLCRVGPESISWERFQEEYKDTIMVKWRSEFSRVEARRILKQFGKLSTVNQVKQITDHTLDRFVSKRLTMPGKKKGETVSPETIKKELRTVRAALAVAVRWKYLAIVPVMPSVDGYGKDKPFVTDKHFDALMKHCRAARLPQDQYFATEEFWKALLGMAWVTGMRKEALISLLWEDVDLDAGVVFSRHHDNKRKKDQRHKITQVARLLRKLYEVRKPGETRVFPWNHTMKSLDRDLARIQKAAGIHLPCREDHEHTEACHLYGFHSFRYAHATYNYGRVTDRELQEQMGHASFNTTQQYIKYAELHQEKAYDAYLPKSLRGKVS